MGTDAENPRSSRGRWRRRCKDDAQYRRQVIKTVWLCLAMFSLGMVSAQRGPAILDLTQGNVQHGSTLFTVCAAGNIVGSLVSSVIYDLWSQSLLLVVSVVMMGVLNTLTPFCSPFPVMAAVSFGTTCFGSSVATAGNTEVVKTWAGTADAALQALHFTFAIGGIVGPLITEPFLLPPPAHPLNNATGIDIVTDHHHFHHHTHLTVLNSDNGSITDHHTHLTVLNSNNGSITDHHNLLDILSENNTRSSSDHSSILSDDNIVHGNSSDRKGNITDHFSILPGDVIRSGIKLAATEIDISVETMMNVTDSGRQQPTPTPSTTPDMRVHWAFLISGCLTFLSALPLMFEYIRERNSGEGDGTEKSPGLESEKKKAVDDDSHAERLELKENKQVTEVGLLLEEDKLAKEGEGGKEELRAALPSQRLAVALPVCARVLVLLWSCVVCLLHVGTEATFHSYLTTFVVLRFSWSKSTGALLTSVFWIFFAASRGVSIFVVRVVSGARLVLLCMLLMVAALALFLLSSWWRGSWEVGVWVSCGLAAAAVAPVFAGYFSWVVRDLLPVSGRVSSAFQMSANLGAMFSPMILGPLMENLSNMWFAYLMLGEATLSLLTFVTLASFTRFFLHRKYVTAHGSQTQTPGKGNEIM